MRRKKPYDGMPINVDPEFVLNTIEAGRLLGVTDREVRAKITRGTLPAVKIGSKYFINRKALFLYDQICKMKNRGRKDARRPAWAEISCSADLIKTDDIQNARPYKALFDKQKLDGGCFTFYTRVPL